MPTVMCPLSTTPPHSHELLTSNSKKRVPYIRCDRFGTHSYFRTDLAKQWLQEHMENGGIYENPIAEGPRTIQERRAMRAGFRGRSNPAPARSSMDTFLEGDAEDEEELICSECESTVPRGLSECPICHASLEYDWVEEDRT